MINIITDCIWKQLFTNIHYDETESVSDVKCTVDGVEEKQKSKVEEEMAKEALITWNLIKWLLIIKLVADMNIEYEDQLLSKWEKTRKVEKQ